MKTALIAILVLVLVVVVGVVAFYQGANYGQAQAQTIRAEFFQSRLGAANGTADGNTFAGAQQGQRGQGGNQANLGAAGRIAANGTVKSVQGNTVEVTSRDGSTVTVTLDAQTVIQKTANGSISDIKPGGSITVLSDQTGDKITARTIQLRETAP